MKTATPTRRNVWVRSAAIFAVLFGVLTIVSGGTALFGSEEAKAMARRGLTLEPHCFWINSEMAWLCEMEGKYREALTYFERERALQPIVADSVIDANIRRVRAKISSSLVRTSRGGR